MNKQFHGLWWNNVHRSSLCALSAGSKSTGPAIDHSLVPGRRGLRGGCTALALAMWLGPAIVLADDVAGFTGAFAPANWTQLLGGISPSGSASFNSAQDSLSLTSGNNNSGFNGWIEWRIAIPEPGEVTFNWAYTSNDGRGLSDMDPFGYVVEPFGFTELVDSYEGNTGLQTGTATRKYFAAGDSFSFRQNTADNTGGTATTIVSNFSFTSYCGSGIVLNPGEWQMLALPCYPRADASLRTLLANSPAANLDASLYGNPDTGWLVFRWDATADPPQYKPLTLDDTLLPGYSGYWIKSNSAPVKGKLAVDGTPSHIDASPAVGCASPNGCMQVQVYAKPDSTRFNLVGNPFPYNVDWAKVRVRVTNWGELVGVYTPSQAQAAGWLSNQIWIWNGNQYDTWSDVSVPAVGNLQYFKSFWVKVLPAAGNFSIYLLIPAEKTTHAQTTQPARDKQFAAGQPWYKTWLDWLIPAAAAQGGDYPQDTPLPELAPEVFSSLSPPPLDQEGNEICGDSGLSGFLSRGGCQQQYPGSITRGREWYVEIMVDNPETGWKDHNTVLGQRRHAKADYDSQDLVELLPFAPPYLTLVFPHPDWGVNEGDYASDFRPITGFRPTLWNFEIRAEPVGSEVVLRWEGDIGILRRSRLVDLQTQAVINPTDPHYSHGYEVRMADKVHRFTWQFLGLY